MMPKAMIRCQKESTVAAAPLVENSLKFSLIFQKISLLSNFVINLLAILCAFGAVDLRGESAVSSSNRSKHFVNSKCHLLAYYGQILKTKKKYPFGVRVTRRVSFADQNVDYAPISNRTYQLSERNHISDR